MADTEKVDHSSFACFVSVFVSIVVVDDIARTVMLDEGAV